MKLLFLMPVHGRFELARLCMERLAHVCELIAPRWQASALVLGDDANLNVARDLGFGLVEQENEPLGRKWNDGYQAACDPQFGLEADYVVPIGSDDWLSPDLLLSCPVPGPREIVCFKRGAFVDPTGTKVTPVKATYKGGLGIRVIPRSLVEAAGWRPAEEHRQRALDTSTLLAFNKAAVSRLKLTYYDLNPYQIVDWKSRGGNLNAYEDVRRTCLRQDDETNPWETLREYYPAEPLAEMRKKVYS